MNMNGEDLTSSARVRAPKGTGRTRDVLVRVTESEARQLDELAQHHQLGSRGAAVAHLLRSLGAT